MKKSIKMGLHSSKSETNQWQESEEDDFRGFTAEEILRSSRLLVKQSKLNKISDIFWLFNYFALPRIAGKKSFQTNQLQSRRINEGRRSTFLLPENLQEFWKLSRNYHLILKKSKNQARKIEHHCAPRPCAKAMLHHHLSTSWLEPPRKTLRSLK